MLLNQKFNSIKHNYNRIIQIRDYYIELNNALFRSKQCIHTKTDTPDLKYVDKKERGERVLTIQTDLKVKYCDLYLF